MNLVIDIGNSLVKAAFVEGDTVMNMSTFQSADVVDVDHLLSAGSSPDRCIVASTGADTSVVAERLRSRGVKVLEMTAQTPVPIGNDYLTPQTLGVDRLAAAVGAAALF